MNKKRFVNAYTLELAIKAIDYVNQEKIEKPKRVFNMNAKF